MKQYRGRRGAYRVGYIGGWGSDVYRLRLASGLTQADVAVLAGVSERTVREHERADWPSGKELGRVVHSRLVKALTR